MITNDIILKKYNTDHWEELILNLDGTTTKYLNQNGAFTTPAGGGANGWLDANETWEYVSADNPTGIFRVNADVTAKYSAGMRVKFTNATNVIYGIITVVGSYGGGYTSITFLHQIDPTDSQALVLMANSAITLNNYSVNKAPYGFPLETNKWSVVYKAIADITTSSPTKDTWYNCYSLSIPVGNWNIGWSGIIGIISVANKTNVRISGTLSTANNSETTTELSAYQGLGSASGTQICLAMVAATPKNILLTSKTTYYFNYRTITASADVSSLVTAYAHAPIIIKAICSYL